MMQAIRGRCGLLEPGAKLEEPELAIPLPSSAMAQVSWSWAAILAASLAMVVALPGTMSG
jgi:hypothetical protein